MSNAIGMWADSTAEPDEPSCALNTKQSFWTEALNQRSVLCLCLLLTVWIAFAPFTRAFFRAEVSYNEGWNVYNAERVTAHQQLYPAVAGWTAVNYPMLSFLSGSLMFQMTHDYVFSARLLSLLSLLLCCAQVGWIVDRLGGMRMAGVLAGVFCLALFCVAGDGTGYVGADDPQIFAQVFFLAGVCVYLAGERKGPALLAVAALFVVGGSIKHNLLEFPLAVLVDLLLTARRRALVLLSSGAAFTAIAVGLQRRMGGPGFVACLLAPRGYSLAKVLQLVVVDLGPLALPLVLAGLVAWRLQREPALRLAVLLFVFSLAIGGYFSGGDGVSVNTFFGVFLTMTLMLGLGLARLTGAVRASALWPIALWAWLVIPWLVVPPLEEGRKVYAVWDPPQYLRQMEDRQERFLIKQTLLESQPGPALCESLLLCASAEKPYLYDPFNATRLIGLGRLEAAPMVEAIREHRFASIQLNGSIDDPDRLAHFAPPIVEAIRAEYRTLLRDQDGEVLVPVNRGPHNMLAAIPSAQLPVN